ncbi:MAG: hypothetical protein K0S38_565 [Candidatus Paceibacter sp.]|jgi:hypothetical protein|nr:hypothetical protein [Candidatus Paceibacter sp.]
MINLHTQRKVEFMTVERATAWVVVAFLVEIRGNERTVLSGPKIVKVILKRNVGLLEGKKQGSTAVLALPAPVSTAFAVQEPVVSPFASNIFGFSNSDFVVSLAARPPTV